MCDVGCTLNVEHNRGLVRRVSHLWDRGVNHGYTCERGKWGYEEVQHPDRLTSAQIREGESVRDAELDEALDFVAEKLRHYQGDQFAALASPSNTNEENYLLQQFARAVMGTNNVDRMMTPGMSAVDRALRDSLGRPSSTNSMQEMFTDHRLRVGRGSEHRRQGASRELLDQLGAHLSREQDGRHQPRPFPDVRSRRGLDQAARRLRNGDHQRHRSRDRFPEAG